MKIYYPEALPISAHRDAIVDSIKQNECVIIEGETGSGKSTQIPKMIYEAMGEKVTIACTQPRRIAAVSIAARIAEECEIEPGLGVGHKIRFDDLTTSQTKIIICTDGILLQEIKFDKLLSKYDAIFVDEAHERSLRIDFLLGILKNTQHERELKGLNPLKIIIASATLDTKKFVEFFQTDEKRAIRKRNIPVFIVSGRMYPVEVFYEPLSYSDGMYLEIAKKISNIHESKKAGDILIFLPGQQEIGLAIQEIQSLGYHDLRCLPLFSRLSMAEQNAIFAPHPGKRHVVVATNIAETSLTIPGITSVIDSGLARMTDFDTTTGIGSLTVEKISQASAIQRAGRAGRIEPGVCYRLYTQEDFKSREFHTKPEIKRSDLADVVLQMVLMEIPQVETFEFIDPPNFSAYKQAFQTLRILGALNKYHGLTDLGVKMAYLPLDPKISKMLLTAKRYDCVEEIAVIASFLSVKNPFLRPPGEEEEADHALKFFQRMGTQLTLGTAALPGRKRYGNKFKRQHQQQYASDLLTCLAAWKTVFKIEDEKSREQYCAGNYLNFHALEEAKSVYQQLIETLTEFGGQEFGDYLKESKSMLRPENLEKPLSERKIEGILKSIASGLIQNLCRQNYQGSYSSQTADRIMIHPGSMFWSRRPQLIIATELIETTKLFARNVTEIDPDWLNEIAPNLKVEKRRMSNPRRNTYFTKHSRRGGYVRRRR